VFVKSNFFTLIDWWNARSCSSFSKNLPLSSILIGATYKIKFFQKLINQHFWNSKFVGKEGYGALVKAFQSWMWFKINL